MSCYKDGKKQKSALRDWRTVLINNARKVYNEEDDGKFPLEFHPLPNKKV
jgi:hypothetical protein